MAHLAKQLIGLGITQKFLFNMHFLQMSNTVVFQRMDGFGWCIFSIGKGVCLIPDKRSMLDFKLQRTIKFLGIEVGAANTCIIILFNYLYHSGIEKRQ